MAIGHKNNTDLISGQVGDLIYQVRGGKQVVYQAPVFSKKKPRTPGMMRHRVSFAGAASLWSVLKAALRDTFERTNPNQRMYNMFMKCNSDLYRPCLRRDDLDNGFQVLDNVVVSDGTLKPDIQVSAGEQATVSDISTGALAIGEETTVQELAAAIVQSNGERFRPGDELLFVQAVQVEGLMNEETHRWERYPKVAVRWSRLPIDLHNPHRVSDLVWPAGFTSYLHEGQHYLSGPRKEGMMMAWVQMREVDRGRKLVTTQRLEGTNPMVEDYTTERARALAYQSFGGVNRENVFSAKVAKGSRGDNMPALPGMPKPDWD